MTRYHIQVAYEPERVCLAMAELPGVVAQGATYYEALCALTEVEAEYLAGYAEDGVSLPEPYAESVSAGAAVTFVLCGESTAR